MQRNTRLTRKTPIRRRSKKRAAQHVQYAIARRHYLFVHPICEVWCKENNWHHAGLDERMGPMYARNPNDGPKVIASTLINDGAPVATEIHHCNKRHGPRLLVEVDWLAVCRANHERIENNKAWARREGFLRNF